jgi:hypothetical protein
VRSRILPNAAARTTPHKPDNMPRMAKPLIRFPLPRYALVLLLVFALALPYEVADSIALSVNDFLQAQSADLPVICKQSERGHGGILGGFSWAR